MRCAAAAAVPWNSSRTSRSGAWVGPCARSTLLRYTSCSAHCGPFSTRWIRSTLLARPVAGAARQRRPAPPVADHGGVLSPLSPCGDGGVAQGDVCLAQISCPALIPGKPREIRVAAGTSPHGESGDSTTPAVRRTRRRHAALAVVSRASEQGTRRAARRKGAGGGGRADLGSVRAKRAATAACSSEGFGTSKSCAGEGRRQVERQRRR